MRPVTVVLSLVFCAVLIALSTVVSRGAEFGALDWIGWSMLVFSGGAISLVWGIRAKLRGLGLRPTETAGSETAKVRVLVESELQELGVTKYKGPEYPHPVIFAERCIGCQACVDACPHDVLAIVDGRAKAVAPDLCMEDTACEAECPVNPKACIVINTTKKVRSRPAPVRSAADYQTNVPGCYIIGDISGVPLIKNAVKEGAEVIGHIAEELKTAPAEPKAEFDVAIVGIGPGGASAAVTAHDAGLRYIGLEQEKILTTIEMYPKGKYIFFKPDSKDWTGGLKVSGLGIGKSKYGSHTEDDSADLVARVQGLSEMIASKAASLAGDFISEIPSALRTDLSGKLEEKIGKELTKLAAERLRGGTQGDWNAILDGFGETILEQLTTKIPGDLRETILSVWKGNLNDRGVRINEFESVKAVKKAEDGDYFTISTEAGDEKKPNTYRARRVVLATGLRGAPTKLRLPNEEMKISIEGREESKVMYALSNPQDFKGRRLIVVGGGNSAVEAAVDLAARRVGNSFEPRPENERNEVTILIRSLIAPTVKFGNKLLLYKAADDGLLNIRFGVAIKEVRAGEVVLEDVRTKKELETIPNDQIFALIGGERPDNFLKSIGIEIV